MLVKSDLEFSILDKNGEEQIFSLRLSDLLLKGSRFKMSDSNNCFLPIFKLPSNLNQDKWLLGTLFLNEYYTAYDMTPYDEDGEDYLQVGIGRINPNGLEQELQPVPPPPPPPDDDKNKTDNNKTQPDDGKNTTQPDDKNTTKPDNNGTDSSNTTTNTTGGGSTGGSTDNN